jgi:hypothetical protein
MSNELPWPKLGSSIFTVRQNGHGCACLNWAQGKLYGYEEGYRRAANLLSEHIAATQTGMDCLVFPLAYLWRHGLELQLKKIIVNCARLRDAEVRAPKSHGLVLLWKLAKAEIVALDEDEPEGTDVVEHILQELEQLDPEATGFRYPENSRGRPNLTSPPQLLDIENFNEVLAGVHMFLSCVNAEIDQRLEWKYEMAAEEAWG